MIKINGKEYGLKFNIYGIEKMQDKNDVSSSMASIYAMVWGGIEGNRYAKELDKDYSFEDVVDTIDALGKDERLALTTGVTKLFLESQAYKSLVPEETNVPDVTEEEKKSEDILT